MEVRNNAMKKSQINLTTEIENGNIMRSLNSDNSSLPSKGDYDKLSLWTLASDVQIDDETSLEDYYTELMDKMSENEYQYNEMVEFLKSKGFGVTEYTDIDTLALRLGTINNAMADALRQITGKTLNDATPLGMVNLMQSINTELLDVLDNLDITATGTQEIVNALDSLS